MHRFVDPYKNAQEWYNAFDEYWRKYYPDLPPLDWRAVAFERKSDLSTADLEVEHEQEQDRFNAAQLILFRDMGVSMMDYITESVKAGKLLVPLQSVHVQRRLAAFKIMANGLALFTRNGRGDEELGRHLWAMIDRFEEDIDFQTMCTDFCSRHGATYRAP